MDSTSNVNTLDLNEISSLTSLTNEQITSIIKEFTGKFEKSINVQNIIDAVVQLMGIVSKIKELTGSQKKELVTKLLLYIVKTTDSGKYDELLDSILIAIIPNVIDNLISVENGEIKINKNIKVKCFPCC
jgi:ribosomal protein S3AE